jgi:hypothetical protein
MEDWHAPEEDKAHDIKRTIAHASVLLRDIPEGSKLRIPK